MRTFVLWAIGCSATCALVSACGGADFSDVGGDAASDAVTGDDGGGNGDGGGTGDGGTNDGNTTDGGGTDSGGRDTGAGCDGGKVCSGICVDTNTDPNNCGGCNVPCTGGSCVGGVCNLIAPDAGTPPPVGDFACIAIDSTSVYVATGLGVSTGGAIYKVPLAGGVPRIIVMNQGTPHGIASDGTSVFWANNSTGEIMKSDTNGMNAAPIAQNQTNPVDVALDATNVYWVNAGTGEVWKASKSGANPTRLMTGLSLNHVGFLAVDAVNAYVADLLGGFIAYAPITGAGQLTKLAQNQSRPVGVGLDTLNVYWTNSMGGTVMKLPKTGVGQPLTIAQNQATPTGLATDGTNVYWANSVMAGGIGRVATGGGTVTPLAMNQRFPNCVAVDGTSVYWINEGGGTISKTAK
jgi:hypothetical protein